MSADRGAKPVEGTGEPPDVDSLMSRLDEPSTAPKAEGASGDRASDPGRPSAAELLGGRGRRTRRTATLRVPDDAIPAATPPPSAVRRSQPPPPAPPSTTAPTGVPVFRMPEAAAPTAADRASDAGRITPSRMISIGEMPSTSAITTASPLAPVAPPVAPSFAAPIAEPPRPVESPQASVPIPLVSAPNPQRRPSTPPPPGRLATPYPMLSPFAAPAEPTPPLPDVMIRPMPVPASAMSSQPIKTEAAAATTEPIAIAPLPLKSPTINNLDATVKQALDLLDREDFEPHGIDIAVSDDEPTMPVLPAVGAPVAAPSASAAREERGPSSAEESLSDDEVVEVQSEPARSAAMRPQAAPPPRKPGSTGQMAAITSESASRAQAATLPSAKATEHSSQPSIVAAAAATAGAPSPAAAQASPTAPGTTAPSGVAVASATAAAAAFPSADATGEVRKKKRQWYEDLFNDDYQRTVPKVPKSYLDREVTFIDESLGCEKGATILDLACGPGEHAVRLAKRGYEVIGIDLSLAMLARAADEAAESQQRINFVQGDMRDLTFEDAFDGVYCWGTSFGFFDDVKNAEVVLKIHKALRRGGRFLLDVVNRDYVIARQPSMQWFEGEGCVCMDEMSVNGINSRLQVKRTMMMEDGRQREIDYSIRLYALHELGKLLHESGFRVAEASGDSSTPGVFFGAESPRILILAEKR